MCMLATAAVLAGAVAVRGIPGKLEAPPDQRAPEAGELVEPMQFLAAGATERLDELAPRIQLERRKAWQDISPLAFDLLECPSLVEWLDSEDGQRTERLIATLRHGSREEAFASLVLLFQVARATQWDPGFLARTQNAERLGDLLRDWLRVWAEPAAKDPLLYEPAIAATLLYGRAMRTAYNAPALRRLDAPFERARTFLAQLTGFDGDAPTPFGRALEERHPLAMDTLRTKKDALKVLHDEAEVLFSDIDGECGR